MLCNKQCSFYRDNLILIEHPSYPFPKKMTLQSYREYEAFLNKQTSKTKQSYCLLARMKVSDLVFCSNRDGIASSDTITCESCGRIVLSNESYFRRYDAILFKWFGECKACSDKYRLSIKTKHSCNKEANRYGICRVCGLVLPGSPYDQL